MASKEIAFVPLDDRPCTRDFAVRLAPLVGWHLRLPPAEAVGTCTTPGRPDALLDWLESVPSPWLLSTDMLLYGGLVGSRSPDAGQDVVDARARRLESLLQSASGEREEVFRVAFTTIMRVPPFLASDEERRFSEKLMAWSQAQARVGRGGGLFAGCRLRALERAIPEAYRRRYLETRARNHAENARVVSWAREGLLDYALVGMDDSRTEGLNVEERRRLEPLVAQVATLGRGSLIPGADELGLLLLARQALRRSGRKPAVWVGMSPDGLAGRVTRYEDRPVGALLQAHLGVLGLETVGSPEQADLRLFVHGPSRGQQEASVQVLPPLVTSRIRRFADEVAQAVRAREVVAVADLGYANGADRALVTALADVVDLPSLAAYAAWNTAGNTVGTVLAHALLRWLSLREPLPGTDPHKVAERHAAFILERLLDDWAYQSEVRSEAGVHCALRQLNIYALGSRHEEIEAWVRERLQARADAFYRRHFEGRTVQGAAGKPYVIDGPLRLDVRLPWPRIFEAAIEPDFEVREA